MINFTPLPAFTDNYIWLAQLAGQRAIVVDPGIAAPVLEALNAQGLTLAALFITHHHADHTGGVAKLLSHCSVPVYGSAASNNSHISHRLQHGDTVIVDDSHWQIMATPGHTLDHICFFMDGEQPALFSGDTLFGAGCGRLFEGSTEQMYDSLQLLTALPAATRVFCAHEYTAANLRFAQTVEPNNTAIAARIASTQQLRANLESSVPSTLAVELDTNPFLRSDQPTVMHAAEQHAGHALQTPVEVFAAIRAWKDIF